VKGFVLRFCSGVSPSFPGPGGHEQEPRHDSTPGWSPIRMGSLSLAGRRRPEWRGWGGPTFKIRRHSRRLSRRQGAARASSSRKRRTANPSRRSGRATIALNSIGVTHSNNACRVRGNYCLQLHRSDPFEQRVQDYGQLPARLHRDPPLRRGPPLRGIVGPGGREPVAPFPGGGLRECPLFPTAPSSYPTPTTAQLTKEWEASSFRIHILPDSSLGESPGL